MVTQTYYIFYVAVLAEKKLKHDLFLWVAILLVFIAYICDTCQGQTRYEGNNINISRNMVIVKKMFFVVFLEPKPHFVSQRESKRDYSG